MSQNKKLLVDSLSEDEGQDINQPPPYTDQPGVKPKVYEFSMDHGPRGRVQDPSLKTIYMGLIAMIFCLWPCGLAAVIIGLQALQSHYRGDLHDARRKNTISKRLTITSVVLGMLLLVGCFALFVVEVLAIMNKAEKFNSFDLTT